MALALGIALLRYAPSAQASPAPIPHGTLELIAENQSIVPGQTFQLGLHFQLEPGWHIYWINPGDSGEPPRVTWRLPSGLAPGTMEWPTPRRLGTSSIVDFGYEDGVTLLVPVHAEPGLPAQAGAHLGAEVNVLVCREMCIPGKTQVALTLPVRSQQPSPDTRTELLFAAARKALPSPAPAGWRLRVEDAKDSFLLTAGIGRRTAQASFFPLVESQIDNAAPQQIRPSASGFRLTLRKSAQLIHPPERLQGVLVLSADRAYSIDVPVSKPGAARSNHDKATHPARSSKEESQR